MIAIKGMDMPKSCNNCRLCVIATTINDLDILCGINSDIDTVSGFTNSRHPKCKLIALPEENKDMSWLQLIDKCKSEFPQKYFQYEENQFGYSKKHTTKIIFLIEDENYPDEVGCIRFREDGVVECGAYAPSEGFFKSKIKPFGMYQIIKALIGETSENNI